MHKNYEWHSSKQAVSAPIDVSRNAQLRDIEASFAACNENFSLELIQHPNKPNVTAVESYPVLPDADIWANQYDLFRFSERPGDRPIDVSWTCYGCEVTTNHVQLDRRSTSGLRHFTTYENGA